MPLLRNAITSALLISGALTLAGNPVVMAEQPNDIIKVTIRGIQMRDGYIAMPEFASRLSDQEILEIANYVRSSWGNGAAPNVTKSLVEKIRANPGL
jgi:mono/diheme cytochrome c family protein